MERLSIKPIIINKFIKKLKSKNGSSGIETIFIFYIGLIIIAFLFQIFSCIAVVLSARDTLDRATLSAASTAMTTPDMYIYLRENSSFGTKVNSLESICEDALETELDSILTNDLGLSKDGNKYSRGEYYTLTIKSIGFDSTSGTFRVNANITIPVNLLNTNFPFNLDLTSNARYANKDE